MNEREEVALTACCSGVLCADPVDGRQAGSCDLCLGVADRIIASHIAPLREALAAAQARIAQLENTIRSLLGLKEKPDAVIGSDAQIQKGQAALGLE